MENVEEMENQLSTIEKSHQTEILSIHENLEQLIYDCNELIVPEDDKVAYDRAVELKRLVKKTHVAIENKRKELKQPIIDYGKRLDEFAKKIYEPLKKAELLVKQKMESYERRQEEIKLARKIEEEQKQREAEMIESKLRNLNSMLERINGASTTSELNEIMAYLDSVNISEFGEKSGDAGFILSQLKLTCSMASRFIESQQLLVKEEPVKQEEIVQQEEPVKQEQVVQQEEPVMDLVDLFDSMTNVKTENKIIISDTSESQLPFEWDMPKHIFNQEKIDAISNEFLERSRIQIENVIYGINQNCNSQFKFYYPKLKDEESINKIKIKVKELFANQLIITNFKSL